MAERIKFYLDEHVPRAVADALRRRGVDVLRVQEIGLMSATDLEHIELAMRQGRVIFSQDVDFLRLHHQGVPHSGIVYASQYNSVGEVVRGLMLIVDVLTSEDMVGRVEFL